MPHPFVAAKSPIAALAAPGLVCYNATRSEFNRQGPGFASGPRREKLHDGTPYRDRLDRFWHFGRLPDRQRRGPGFFAAGGALGGRLSTGRGHRHHRAADRAAAVGTTRPAI